MHIKQVIIWGHKLHSHTHSYIHNGFFIAFNKLGLKTYYYDDNDDVRNHDFCNSLFITEHQVNKKIPLRTDCLYLTHYIDDGDYVGVPIENIIMLKVSLRDFVEKDLHKNMQYTELSFGQKYEYHAKDENGYNCLYMYWATDLLPDEIDDNIKNINNISICNKEVNFVGSMTSIWRQFYHLCKQNQINFNQFGATFNINSNRNVSIYDNMILIKKSLLSPALQDDMQVQKKYIPCRIFKNISYGKMGITNNKIVNDLFDQKLIYDIDLNTLIQKCLNFENNPNKNTVIIELMRHVRDHHTYINRANTIMSYVNKYTTFKI
jgi:hypothetical protein